MKKKVFETSSQHIIAMYGYLGTKSGELLDMGVAQWEDAFTESCHFADAGHPDTYDTVWFLRNTNFHPFYEKSPGIWVKDSLLPVFHAAVAFVRAGEPRQLYLFNHDKDLTAMLKTHPYEKLRMEDGRSYIDVAKQRGVQFFTLNCRKAPVLPTGWMGDGYCFDGFDLISLPCWLDRGMRDAFVQDLPAKILDTIELSLARAASSKPSVSYCKEAELLSPRYRYIFELPGAEVHIYHVVRSCVVENQMILMIQNDMIPVK